MALLKDPKQEAIGSLSLNFGSGTIGSEEMDFGKIFTGGYFKYHMSLFGDIFNTMETLTTPALCKSYFLKNNEDE
ncbi:unnamed protein product [Macrosiphum euphorbiae]|uniref:Uncharacterized protein n=1 Tax=Macrosiphum euphorbiae TaxID=13131 RepID=A0AAV0VYD0_9HEMI|nr:unnamed protein product [Macrosiphum euphorbiae]